MCDLRRTLRSGVRGSRGGLGKCSLWGGGSGESGLKSIDAIGEGRHKRRWKRKTFALFSRKIRSHGDPIEREARVY